MNRTQHLPSLALSTTRETRWANDKNGFGLTAQPGESQGRPQRLCRARSPSQARPAHPTFSQRAPGPVRPTLTPRPDTTTRAPTAQFHPRRLCAAVIRRHSERVADLPRRWRRSQRRLNFVSAKTGSIMPWRLGVETAAVVGVEHAAHEGVKAAVPARAGALTFARRIRGSRWSPTAHRRAPRPPPADVRSGCGRASARAERARPRKLSQCSARSLSAPKTKSPVPAELPRETIAAPRARSSALTRARVRGTSRARARDVRPAGRCRRVAGGWRGSASAGPARRSAS